MRRKKLTKEERGNDGFEINQKIIENEDYIRRLHSENAKLYSEVQDRQLYKDILGDEEAEWSAFLSQIRVYRSRNEIHNLIKVYKKYEVEFGISLQNISDVPILRLATLIPLVNNENVHDLLSEARTLLPKDWKIRIRELKNLPVEDDCKHEFVEYKICKICGQKHKINENCNEEDFIEIKNEEKL